MEIGQFNLDLRALNAMYQNHLGRTAHVHQVSEIPTVTVAGSRWTLRGVPNPVKEKSFPNKGTDQVKLV